MLDRDSTTSFSHHDGEMDCSESQFTVGDLEIQGNGRMSQEMSESQSEPWNWDWTQIQLLLEPLLCLQRHHPLPPLGL